MADLALLAIPLGGLAFLVAIGAGVAVGLGRRLPPDAQAALAPVAGAALVACASPLLPLGVPARPLALAVAALGVAATIVLRAHVARALRAGMWPAVVAVVAIALAGAPSVVRGDWRVTSLYGSTDAYHWSSQARAYLDRPAPEPASQHPDRVTYERSRTQHWAVALPFGLLQVAWVTGSDPPDVYGALAALLFCLLPLAVFAAARACLGWRARIAALAALTVAANAALLFASHFSWQQQVAGTAFAFAGAVALRLALEPDSRTREKLLAAAFAGAALATYRMGFAPFVALVLGSVVAAYALANRRRQGEARRIGRAAGVFALLLACVAAPSVLAVVRGFPEFVSAGGFSTAFKRSFPTGQLAEALGFVPSVWSVKEDWPAAARVTWLTIGSVAAAALLVAGWRAVRGVRAPRADFVAAGVLLALGGYCVLLLPPFSPYLSFKLLSYTAPFLVLLAVAPVALARGRTRAAAALAVAVLALPSAAVATVAAADASTPGELAALRQAAADVPRDAVVGVSLDDPWEQAWALYYLREHRLSVERPSFLLVAQGRPRPSELYRHTPVAYVVTRRPAGEVVWRGRELALVRVS